MSGQKNERKYSTRVIKNIKLKGNVRKSEGNITNKMAMKNLILINRDSLEKKNYRKKDVVRIRQERGNQFTGFILITKTGYTNYAMSLSIAIMAESTLHPLPLFPSEKQSNKNALK